MVGVDGLASARFLNKNVGSDKPVIVSGLTLTGADAANYVSVAPSLSASITPAHAAGLGPDGQRQGL